jgi:hypothetical protein
MDFLASLHGRPITLERCSPAMVEQLNAIANFCGHATVETVIAVFECDTCGLTRNVDIELASAFPQGKLQPVAAPNCAKCRTPLSLDDDTDR